MADSKNIVKQHVIPILASLGVIGVLSVAASTLFPFQKLLFITVSFVLGGILIGYLTPINEETVDHRGTNGIFVMMVGWSAYILFARTLFPEVSGISGWVFAVMGSNAINGFAIILGAFIGTLASRHAKAQQAVSAAKNKGFSQASVWDGRKKP